MPCGCSIRGSTGPMLGRVDILSWQLSQPTWCLDKSKPNISRQPKHRYTAAHCTLWDTNTCAELHAGWSNADTRCSCTSSMHLLSSHTNCAECIKLYMDIQYRQWGVEVAYWAYHHWKSDNTVSFHQTRCWCWSVQCMGAGRCEYQSGYAST